MPCCGQSASAAPASAGRPAAAQPAASRGARPAPTKKAKAAGPPARALRLGTPDGRTRRVRVAHAIPGAPPVGATCWVTGAYVDALVAQGALVVE